MIPAILDFEAYRGDDWAHRLLFVNYDQTALNVSEYTFKAQVRNLPENGTILYATMSIDMAQANLGIVDLGLRGSATRFPPGYWDLQVEYGGIKTTWFRGEFKTFGDVTQEVYT